MHDDLGLSVGIQTAGKLVRGARQEGRGCSRVYAVCQSLGAHLPRCTTPCMHASPPSQRRFPAQHHTAALGASGSTSRWPHLRAPTDLYPYMGCAAPLHKPCGLADERQSSWAPQRPASVQSVKVRKSVNVC